jgi:hypothetical protein
MEKRLSHLLIYAGIYGSFSLTENFDFLLLTNGQYSWKMDFPG